tara:strand:- start:16388 stop:16636 length:249 start_codon:yes stop_codon:yes gene_type:complete
MITYRIEDIPDDRGWLTTTWGKAVGSEPCSFICHHCAIIWRANFPRNTILGVRNSNVWERNPCPSCIKNKLKKYEGLDEVGN